MERDEIEIFLKALAGVKAEHYRVPQARQNKGVLVTEDSHNTYENNFTTKLCEQYAILENKGEILTPDKSMRQVQVPKKIVFESENMQNECNKIYRLLGEKTDLAKELGTIPDFVIHRSQDDDSPQHQRLIAEVKTEQNLSYNKFAWDFFKLNIYKHALHFQSACFLIVNTPFDTVEKHLRKYLGAGFFLSPDKTSFAILVKENADATARRINLWETEYLDKGMSPLIV